jgi:hypothetical protein
MKDDTGCALPHHGIRPPFVGAGRHKSDLISNPDAFLHLWCLQPPSRPPSTMKPQALMRAPRGRAAHACPSSSLVPVHALRRVQSVQHHRQAIS